MATGQKLVEHDTGALWPEHATWSPGPADGSKGRGATLALSAGSKISLWNEKGEPLGEPVKFPRAIVDLQWVLGGSTLAIALPITARATR